MKFLLFIILVVLYSCSYPDIDTVPKFSEVKLTDEEAVDLCNLSSTNTDYLSKRCKKLNRKMLIDEIDKMLNL